MEAGSLVEILAGRPVHIWWREAVWTAEDWDLLSGDERARCERFHFERDRASYIAAHALTRRGLSELARVEPAAWRFTKSSAGKPAIANELERPLGFNLSHSRGMVACAAAWECEIGVDVEATDRSVDESTMRAVLTAEEWRELEAGRKCFFEYWTLKEAYLKGLGTGISDSLGGLEIARVGGGWSFFQAQPGPRHRLAVAAKRS